MSSVPTAEYRDKICERFSALKEEEPGRYDALLDRMISAVRNAGGRMLSDVFADEKLIAEKFRNSALKAEKHIIDGIMPAEFFSTVIFDSIEMNVDPWENVKMRGWEFGKPAPVPRVKLQPTTDPLELSLQRILRGRKECAAALEKIKQGGLNNAWEETVEAVSVPLVLLESKERMRSKKEQVSQALHAWVEQFGEKAVEELVVERFTEVVNDKIVDERLNQSALAEAFDKLCEELA